MPPPARPANRKINPGRPLILRTEPILLHKLPILKAQRPPPRPLLNPQNDGLTSLRTLLPILLPATPLNHPVQRLPIAHKPDRQLPSPDQLGLQPRKEQNLLRGHRGREVRGAVLLESGGEPGDDDEYADEGGDWEEVYGWAYEVCECQ